MVSTHFTAFSTCFTTFIALCHLFMIPIVLVEYAPKPGISSATALSARPLCFDCRAETFFLQMAICSGRNIRVIDSAGIKAIVGGKLDIVRAVGVLNLKPYSTILNLFTTAADDMYVASEDSAASTDAKLKFEAYSSESS